MVLAITVRILLHFTPCSLNAKSKQNEEGKKFIPQYKQILSAGGSKSPEDILTDAGFNFYDPTFWQGGFDFLTEKMTEIEKN